MTDLSGLLIVDKPAGLTSHDVVNRVRRLAGTRRVGHAGTLDPMATGVLVIGVNRATKLLTYITGASKEYYATIRLGVSTATDDAEGDVLESAGCPPLSVRQIDASIVPFRGDIEQIPSAVSAIKVDGKRAYQRVRNGEVVTLPARPVTVFRFEIVGEPRSVNGFLDIDVQVECSSGTYIRALARDLGQALNVGGHLTALRRTKVGHWGIDGAVTLDELSETSELPLAGFSAVCPELFPVAQINDDQAAKFRNGQAPFLDRLEQIGDGIIALANSEGNIVGLVHADAGKLKTELVVYPAGIGS